MPLYEGTYVTETHFKCSADDEEQAGYFIEDMGDVDGGDANFIYVKDIKEVKVK